MSKMNIRGSTPNDDPSYRYKMSAVDGIPSGTFLQLSNLEEISGQLGRELNLLLRFLSSDIGGKIGTKKGHIGHLIKGGCTIDRIQNAVYRFIDLLVLCPTCANPETQLSRERKKGPVMMGCSACGQNTEIICSKKDKALEKALKEIKQKSKKDQKK